MALELTLVLLTYIVWNDRMRMVYGFVVMFNDVSFENRNIHQGVLYASSTVREELFRLPIHGTTDNNRKM